MYHRAARHRFRDFGQLREQLSPFWDIDATQISAGPLSLGLDWLNAGDIVLSHLRFDRAAALRCVGASGWHALSVHASPARWCGMDLPPDALLTISPGSETWVLSSEPWESISVFVRGETLAAWGPPFVDLGEPPASPERCILAVDPAAVCRYRAWVRTVFGAAPGDGVPGGEASWSAAIRDVLKERLHDVLGRKPGPRLLSQVGRIARYDVALAALRMVQRSTDRRLTVGDLSRALGVTERTLQYAFIRVIGVSPAQYILADRLNRARRHLIQTGRSGGTVTAAAYDHQFENLSRFALQYARLFGERPSDTLNGARETVHHAQGPRPCRTSVRSPGSVAGGPAADIRHGDPGA